MKSRKLQQPKFHWFSLGLLVTLLLTHHGYADAPVGRYIASNGTVLDTETNLLWQQGHQGNAPNWSNAQSYCDGLSLNGLGGWRVPTVKELQTIVDEKQTTPFIDPTAFPMTPAEGFWTSSPWTGSSSMAWFVNFYNGGAGYVDVAAGSRVRCVRNP